jgi:AcrR family transcriptional regulator
MDDLCHEMGMSKKTIYQYFKNKEEILRQGMISEATKESCKYQEIENQPGNAIDALLEVSRLTSILLNEMNPAFAFDLKKYYPEIFREYLTNKRTHIYNKIRENMLRGINEGLYRAELKVDLEARLYVQKLEDMFDSEFNLPQEKMPFSKIFKVMFENHIRGISTTKGIEYFESKQQTLKFKI